MTPVPHDFRQPIRLQTPWQNRLTAWFRSALSLANKTWEKDLPGVRATFGEVRVAFASDLLATLPDNTFGYTTRVDPPHIISILALPRSLMVSLVNSLLGSADGPAEDRELTLVEANLANYFLTHYWLPFFRDSWPGPKIVPWQLDDCDRQPQCSRKFTAGEVAIVLDLTITGPWGETKLSWLFQQSQLMAALDPASAAVAPVTEATLTVRREAIVRSLPLLVQITLGTASLSLSNLSELKVGDVVLLDQHTAEGVAASAGGQVVFRGKPGRVGAWRAVQIDHTRDK